MGAFMEPVQDAFRWSRAEYSSGLSVYAVVGVVLAPLIGVLIDRRGPRLVAVIGCLLVGVAFALLATASSSILWWLALWVIFASACQLIMPTLWSAAIAGTFTASLGLALSVAIAGSGLAAFVFPFVANALIEHFDFRIAYLVMGLGFGIPTAVISAFAMPPPTAQPSSLSEQPRGEPAHSGLSLPQGLRSLIFYKLALAILVTNLVSMALVVHLIPLLAGAGLTRDAAVFVAGAFFGIAAMVGKVLGGAALDRFAGRLVASGFVTLLIASVAMLALPAMTFAWATVAATMFGLAYGALAPVWPYLASRYFGLRAYGRLFGIMSSCYALALALGPMLAGHVHDLTHSYRIFLLGGLPALLVILLATLSLGRYPDFVERT
jgi:MFS family permease